METKISSGEDSSSVIDFSLLSLFVRADLVVKSVIIILILASIWSWTIIVEKLVKMKRLKQHRIITFLCHPPIHHKWEDLIQRINYMMHQR